MSARGGARARVAHRQGRLKMSRPRKLLLAAGALLVIVALAALSLLSEFFVDLLWFDALHYGATFATMVAARWALLGSLWAIAFAVFLLNGLVALRLSGERQWPRVVRRPDEVVPLSLPDLLRNFGARVPWKALVTLVAALLGFAVASGESTNWPVYLKALYATRFDIVDPIYQRDVGFYVFALPWLEDLRDLFLWLIILSGALSVAIYWLRQEIDFTESPPRVSANATAHLSVLLAAFFVQRAFSYWLGRFELLLHGNGVVYGFRYVDRLLWQPGLWLLIILSLAAAAMCLANLGERGVRLPLMGALILFIPAVVLNFLQPAIEQFRVKPNELALERPYLVHNIELTRRAYRLDAVSVKPFAGLGKLSPEVLKMNQATVKNIRLWDPRPLLATYRQLQEIRLYYDFRDVDVDRYQVQGEYKQVMLSAREFNPALLPENARTWVNQHLNYTHGFGLVMSPVTLKSGEGLPIFYLKDVPPVSPVGLEVEQPRIYYGQEDDNYVIVDTAEPEFDYPKGANNVFSYYQGRGGVRISSIASRALFSYYYRDLNLLLTSAIRPKSQILLRRNISDRIGRLAPFLIQDRDPYLVLNDGRLSWIVDCYTVSDHYPYAEPNADNINYIRNAVKTVIDAYTGETTFYVADPDDPIIQCWSKIFPKMFRPMSAMPAALRIHIRYPEDLFMIQADVYRTYHMRDPEVFYNREDLWGFARENYAGQTVVMQAYYTIMRLPGEMHEEFILMIPMVPRGRDNMISWLAARCDGENYGRLLEYAFSKEKLVYGPYQIEARINQNPAISRQISLWNQMGSRVVLGNMMVTPIADTLLYVEPLYLRAENGQLPELQRVIAAYGDRVTMGEDLDDALAQLFSAPSAGVPETVQAAPPQAARAPQASAIGAASTAYQQALEALRAGNWAEFGAQMQKLGQALNQPAAQ
jgi:uncharacterized membrane protein (UPF0182 family)